MPILQQWVCQCRLAARSAGVAEHAVGAPGDEVGDAGRDLEAAAREVGLHGLRLGHRLDVPFATAAGLGATPSGGEPIDVELGVLIASTGRRPRDRFERAMVQV